MLNRFTTSLLARKKQQFATSIQQIYIKRDILALYISDPAQADLDELIAAGQAKREEARQLRALIDEISGNEDVVWRLHLRSTRYYNPNFETKAIEFLQVEKYNIYRLRPIDDNITKYRIIYAFDNEYDDFYVLAIVRKKPANLHPDADPAKFYNYEPSHPITNCIRDEYDAICIPKLP